MINDTLNDILAGSGTQKDREIASALLSHIIEIPDMDGKAMAALCGCSEEELNAFLSGLGYVDLQSFQKDCDNYHKAISKKPVLFDPRMSLAENIEDLTEKKLQTIRYSSLHLGQDRLRELAEAAMNSRRIYIFAQGSTRPLAHYLRTELLDMDLDVVLTDRNLLKDYKAEQGDLFIFLSIIGQSFKINPNIMAKVDKIQARKWLITCNYDIDFRGHRWVIPVEDLRYSKFAMMHALDLLVAEINDLYDKGL